MKFDGCENIGTPLVISSNQPLINEVYESSQSEIEMNACYTIHRELLNSRNTLF